MTSFPFHQIMTARVAETAVPQDSHLIKKHAIHIRNEMPHGPSQQHLHTMTKSDTVITTSDPCSGGSVFDSRPLCIPPNRYMNPAGLTEVSLSKAKIKNTAEGKCLANGVQMVTLDCTIQCAIILRSLNVTHKFRKYEDMRVSQVQLTVVTLIRKRCTARIPHGKLIVANARLR
jgi:hypothetical protein